MSSTIRASRRGNSGPSDWVEEFDSSRDGLGLMTPSDREAIRQMNRDRRHKDKAKMRSIRRDAEAYNNAVFEASQRRDVCHLPSW